MSTPTPDPARRRYDSPVRRHGALRTRERVLSEASRLFVTGGYGATSLAAVARAAGVSVPTVLSGFGSKATLLKEAIDVALVGDVEPEPLADRPSMRRVRGAASLAEVVERYAELAQEVADRAHAIVTVAFAAAGGDPAVADIVRTLESQRLAGVGAVAAVAAERAGVTDPRIVDLMRDVLWATFSLQPYDHLVVQRGWPGEAYRGWLVAVGVAGLTAVIDRSRTAPGTGAAAGSPPGRSEPVDRPRGGLRRRSG
jgi:AcrR family transcriptional regulator